jgi:hypothetical protein
MLAPAFRYAHQDLPIAAGELARDQPDPGSKMSSVFELGSVADGRNDRGGRLRAIFLSNEAIRRSRSRKRS